MTIAEAYGGDCDDGPYGDGGVDLDTVDLEGTCLGKDSKMIRLVFKGVADVLLSQAVPDCCNIARQGTTYKKELNIAQLTSLSNVFADSK